MKKGNHLWKRIFSQYAVLFLVSFSLIFTTVYFTMSRVIQLERRSTMEQQLEICTSQLDTRIEEVMSIHTQILNAPSFRSCIQSYCDGTITEAQANNLSSLLADIKSSSWLVNNIYVLNNEKQVISNNHRIMNEDTDVSVISDLAAELSRTRGFRTFCTANGKLFFIGAIYLDNSYNYVTHIAIELNASRMFFNFTTTALKSFQSVYVTDQEQIVCQAGNTEVQYISDLAKTNSAEYNGTAYAVFSCRSSNYANWIIYTLMDESSFHQAVRQQSSMIILVLLISLFFTLVISLVFTRRITQPLENLTLSFQRLEQGDFPPPLEITSNDEVGQLVQGYNHVVKSLKRLSDNIIAQQEEKRRFEIAAVKTRLDLLQSQIHPHFIHNTLNTLNYMAIDAGNTSLSQLITSFNALLRMSISNESDFCTVETEIECIQHYMRILRCRYADRPLECIYTIDEQAKSALLPRLLLQPLVENAIYHGILPVENRLGVIRVQCTASDNMLYVSVSDNGIGISPDTLQRIKDGHTFSANGYSHIGIKNVKERLQILYHQECDFQIITAEGQGTTIFFTVPCRREPYETNHTDRG